MAKRVAVLVIALLLIAGAVGQSLYLGRVLGELDALSQAVAGADEDGLGAAVRALTDRWDEEQAALHLLLEHDDLLAIELELTDLRGFSRGDGDPAAACARLRLQLQRLARADRLGPENIF